MYRVSEQYNLPNCQNNFDVVKNVIYFEFLKFSPKMLKQNILEKEKKYFADYTFIAMSW